MKRFLEIKEPTLPTFEEFCEVVSSANERIVVFESLGIKITAYTFLDNWEWHTIIGNKRGWVTFSVRGYTSTRKVTKDFNERSYYAALEWAKQNRERRLREMLGGELELVIKE